MTDHIISSRSTAHDFVPVMLCIHEVLNRLPVTARSSEHPGVRIENGVVVDDNYTGPVLEQVIAENAMSKSTPESGVYMGVPVMVAPLRDSDGSAMGAIGVVDITGIFDLATLMEHQSMIIRQVCGRDPCPLPAELITSKR